MGYHIQGILDDHKKAGYVYKKVQVLGPISHLETFLAANTLDEIVITLSIGEYANLEQIVAACEKSGVHTKFIPDYNNIIPTIPYMEDLQGLPVIHIRHVPLTSVFNATIKRMVDICGALFGSSCFASYAADSSIDQTYFSRSDHLQPGEDRTAQPSF